LIVALIRATLFRRQILMMLLTGPVIGAASGISGYWEMNSQ
jgi:hypothetical protein